MSSVRKSAPSGNQVVEYDRSNLALYAALLEVADAGQDWRDSATSLMLLDVTDPEAEACWQSHVERARWIIGEGLENAIVAFNKPPQKVGSR